MTEYETEKPDFKLMIAMVWINVSKTEMEKEENTQSEFRATEWFKQLIKELGRNKIYSNFEEERKKMPLQIVLGLCLAKQVGRQRQIIM